LATNKQITVAKDLMENKGKPVSRAMLDAGYDPRTAKNPQQLTKSIGWQELMDKYLPDDKLLKVHEEAMEAKKWNDFTGEREPDHTTRLKAVDLGYKLKGKIGGTQVNILNQGDMNMGLLIQDDKTT
jgi:hypothetical protein